jgi:hypothetical protein
MRLLEIDTPETFQAQCDRERHLGEKAKLWPWQSLQVRSFDAGEAVPEGNNGT